MVSTNSTMSSFVPFVLDGREQYDEDPAKDFEAITAEVLKRLAPALQYVIRKTIPEQVSIEFGSTLDYHEPSREQLDMVRSLKVIYLSGPLGDDELRSQWFLSHTGKFILLMTSNRLGYEGTFYQCMEIAPTSAYAGIHRLHEHPLEVFFDKLYGAFDESIKQAEERLANMKGRSGWLAEVMSRYQSTIDTPHS